MRLMTTVEYYVGAAMDRAVIEPYDNGTFAAYVPECPGVIASGSDPHECAQDLYRRLEEWVKVSLARGNTLPVIGDIDLNAEADRLLATYDPQTIEAARSTGSNYFPDEASLEAAFERADYVDQAS